MGLDCTVRNAWLPGSLLKARLLSETQSSQHPMARAEGVEVSSTSHFEGESPAL